MRINAGTAISVTATELWLSEIRAGNAFARGIYLAASVGNLSEIQLFNPVASNKIVIVRSILAASSGLSSIDLRTHNTALGTLVGAGVNLLAGAAAAQGELRTATPAAADGTSFATIRAAAETELYIVPDWFMELGAGEGLIVTSVLANSGNGAFFTWREV